MTTSLRSKKRLAIVSDEALRLALDREVAIYNRYRFDVSDVGIGKAIDAFAEAERVGDEVRRRKGLPSNEQARKQTS